MSQPLALLGPEPGSVVLRHESHSVGYNSLSCTLARANGAGE